MNTMMNSIQSKVLVRCMTYNHEHYIDDALNGFVMQKTDFPFTVVVVDDASTDNNANIIKRFISKYCSNNQNYTEEDKEYGKVLQAQAESNQNCAFYIILLKENHYQQGKLDLRDTYYASVLSSAKYIAICEGDDYWTDSNKLQKQVDFMDTHPEYVMCCHSVDWYQEGELIKQNIICQHDLDLRTEDIISQGGYYINICSVLFKKELMANRTNYQKIATVGDHPLCIKAALSGKVRFLHETMSVYRCFVKNVRNKSMMMQCSARSVEVRFGMMFHQNHLLYLYLLSVPSNILL